MLAGPQLSLCSSVNQHQPMASDWAEHFGFSYLIMRVLNAVCCGLGQNKLTRGCNKGCFPSWKGFRMACHSAGSCRAQALLKKSFRELRSPSWACDQEKKKTHMLNKTPNKYSAQPWGDYRWPLFCFEVLNPQGFGALNADLSWRSH